MMTNQHTTPGSLIEPRMPALEQLGHDLLGVSPARQVLTLALPFVAMGAYALFAWLGWWPLAVFSVMVLSFVTYGSSSHDLVHRNLRLPRRFNDFMLSLIEWLSLRSGTAYRLSHLHHHKHLLEADDIEGTAAHGSLWKAIASGPSTQVRLWLWAWAKQPSMRRRLGLEAVGVVALIVGAVASVRWSMAPLIYVILVIGGSWFYPFSTVYLTHDGRERTPLRQTRLFRGWLVQTIALDHLYHLEHHLYPAVPHHHWRALADRLEPYFERAGVKPWGKNRPRKDTEGCRELDHGK
jgi:beta-carotene hydroxylase